MNVLSVSAFSMRSPRAALYAGQLSELGPETSNAPPISWALYGNCLGSGWIVRTNFSLRRPSMRLEPP